MLHVICQSISYHVIEDCTMASIYLHCIVAAKTNLSSHGLTIVQQHSSCDQLIPWMYIHCMLLVYACYRFIMYSVHIRCMLGMRLLMLLMEIEEQVFLLPPFPEIIMLSMTTHRFIMRVLQAHYRLLLKDRLYKRQRTKWSNVQYDIVICTSYATVIYW